MTRWSASLNGNSVGFSMVKDCYPVYGPIRLQDRVGGISLPSSKSWAERRPLLVLEEWWYAELC